MQDVLFVEYFQTAFGFSNLPKTCAVISDSEDVEIILFTHWLMPCTAFPDFLKSLSFAKHIC